jgi:hypothetical protein
MSVSIQPAQAANQQAELQAAQQAKTAAATNAAPEDKVTISDSAKQALANNTKPAGGA